MAEFDIYKIAEAVGVLVALLGLIFGIYKYIKKSPRQREDNPQRSGASIGNIGNISGSHNPFTVGSSGVNIDNKPLENPDNPQRGGASIGNIGDISGSHNPFIVGSSGVNIDNKPLENPAVIRRQKSSAKGKEN